MLDSTVIAIRSSTSSLERWNALSREAAAAAVLPCCGSVAWAHALAATRPVADAGTLLAHSDAIWAGLGAEDWQQAFESHPRLGESHAKAATDSSLRFSREEQSHAGPTEALRLANERYEQKFGRIFLLCASGRTEPEILFALERRMTNTSEAEWQEAGEQQRQITRLRLERWLGGQQA